MTGYPWTDAEHASMTKLWTEGKSCSEIRDALNASFNTKRTRNAVIGRLHRNGFNRANQGSREARASLATYRPAKKRAPAKIASLGCVPAVVGIDYKLNPATAEQQAAARAYGMDKVGWVESGAGVISLNARPFAEATGCMWPLKDGLFCCNKISRRKYCAGHAAVAGEGFGRAGGYAFLTKHDGVVDKYRPASGVERTAWDEGRLAA